ncbi:MAG TPA: hypothetical protein VK041_04230 [Opitutales bacterium]|nr:hypothetical protein [Opitutales bacterium]
MKSLKVALIAVGGFFVLLVLVVVLFSLPAVQRSLVVRMVSDDNQELELEYFHAGPRKVEIRALDFRQNGALYQASEVAIDFSLSKFLFGGEIKIGELVATDLLIDLSALEMEEDVPEEKELFEGVLEQLKLPMPVSIETVRVDGEIILPEFSDLEPMVVDFQIRGGDIAPNQEGELQWKGELKNSGVAGALASLQVDGNLGITQDSECGIERARLLALFSASEAAVGFPEKLSADIVLLAIDGGEEYRAQIRQDQADDNPGGDLSTLIMLDAIYQQEDGKITGRWEIQVDEEQLAAFVGETELPAFSANGEGDFTYGTSGELAAAGDFQFQMESLGSVVPQLAELGAFSIETTFDLSMDEAAVRLSTLLVELQQEDETILEVRNFEQIAYDLESERLEGEDGRLDLAEIVIHALPIEWANLFLTEQETTVEGGAVTGRLLVSSEDGGILFDLTDPFRAEGIAVTTGGEVLLNEVAFLVGGSGSFAAGEFQATVEPLELSAEGQNFLNGSAQIASTGPIEANLSANLPLLLNLPMLSDLNNLSSGRADAALSVSAGDLREVRATVALRDLVTAAKSESLADVDIEAALRETAENSWQIEAPIRLVGAETSDLSLNGEIEAGEVLRFDLSLTGEQVFADQFLALSSGFSAPETEEPSAPTPEPDSPQRSEGRDEEAFWGDVSGQVRLDLGQVFYEEDYVFEQIRGNFSLAPEKAAVSLEVNFLDEAMIVDAAIDFLANEEEPYRLSGAAEAPNLPVGALFRQFQPDRPPTLEGLFAASIEISGSGQNLNDLIDGARGRIRMKSGGGVIRLFHTDNPLAGLGFAATAILGQVGGDVGAISNVANQLRNMSYNEINLQAERDEELNFVVEEFTVVAPELYLQGNGTIRHRDGVPIVDQAMNLRFQMGVQGSLERTLDNLRVLSNEPGVGGYVFLRDPFVITGTPSEPNSQAFYAMLVNTMIRFIEPNRRETPDEEERQRSPLDPLQDVLDIFDRLGRGGS